MLLWLLACVIKSQLHSFSSFFPSPFSWAFMWNNCAHLAGATLGLRRWQFAVKLQIATGQLCLAGKSRSEFATDQRKAEGWLACLRATFHSPMVPSSAPPYDWRTAARHSAQLPSRLALMWKQPLPSTVSDYNITGLELAWFQWITLTLSNVSQCFFCLDDL